MAKLLDPSCVAVTIPAIAPPGRAIRLSPVPDCVTGYPLEDAGKLLTRAREDAHLTQAELAAVAGVQQPVISAIENGRRKVNAELLDRLLRAAKLRPSVPLELYADVISDTAHRFGIADVRVFGSTVHGTDTSESDVDLLVTLGNETSFFDLAGFHKEVESILGFPVDILTDDSESPIVAQARSNAVAL